MSKGYETCKASDKLSFKIIKLFFNLNTAQNRSSSSPKVVIRSLKWIHSHHYIKHTKNLANLAFLYFNPDPYCKT